MARKGINAKQLKEILDGKFYTNDPRGQAAKSRVQADLARSTTPLAKRNELPALDRKATRPSGMVDIPCPVLVRLVRHIPKGGKEYDDDNLSGGLKECRDAIAAALGLKGDSEADGIAFTYAQIKSPTGIAATEIEVYTNGANDNELL